MSIEAIYLAWSSWRSRCSGSQARRRRPRQHLGRLDSAPVGAYPSGAPTSPSPTGSSAWRCRPTCDHQGLAGAGSALLGVVVFDRHACDACGPPARPPIAAWCLWPPSRRVRRRAAALCAARDRLPRRLLGRAVAARPRSTSQAETAGCSSSRAWSLSALACLPFSLIEGAFGPTLYGWLYEPHPFPRRRRRPLPGYRPIGFFEHGNQFGIWISLCAFAAIWLALAAPPGRRRSAGRGRRPCSCVMPLAAQSIGALLLLALGAAACRPAACPAAR